jgi:hypothetical protein
MSHFYTAAAALLLLSGCGGGEGFSTGAYGAAGAAGEGGEAGGAGAGGSGAAGAPGGAGGAATGGAGGEGGEGAGGTAGAGGEPACTPQEAWDHSALSVLPTSYTWEEFSYQYEGICIRCDQSPCATFGVSYEIWPAQPPTWLEPTLVRWYPDSTSETVPDMVGNCGAEQFCSFSVGIQPKFQMRIAPNGGGWTATLETLEPSGSFNPGGCGLSFAHPKSWTGAAANSLGADIKTAFAGPFALECPP